MNAQQSMFDGTLVKSTRILYTPSVFAKTNLIYLQETGELKAQKPHTSSRENLSSYLFFLVVEGDGILEYEGIPYTLKAGDCVFLDCRRPYAHRTSENLWKLKWVHFYGPNLSGIYKKYTERGGHPCFRPKNPASFDRILTELYTDASSSSYIRDMQIYEKLVSLLTLLMAESWNPSHTPKSIRQRQNLLELKEYLEQHYMERISLDTLSDRFYINKFYLSRLFKEQFGVTVAACLLQIRITHAKQLLRFTGKSIEQIGKECGIQDANYFSRTFKKVEGVTPGEFRRLWQT